MAESHASSSSQSSAQSAQPATPKPKPAPKLSPEAQAIVDRLQQSQSVFVSKDDLSEDDQEDLEEAGYGVDEDVVRGGYFVHVLNERQLAEREAQSASTD